MEHRSREDRPNLAIRRKKRSTQKSDAKHRINEEIAADRVRLIDLDGTARGIFLVHDAVRMAQDKGLDLVEVGPNSKPPTAKFMNYSKFKFQQQKAQKKPKKVKQKEVKLKPYIQDRDREFKTKQAIKFLNSGHKLRVTIMFSGRQMAHTELGKELLDKVSKDLIPEHGSVESEPNLEGRNMSMIIVPVEKVDSVSEQ